MKNFCRSLALLLCLLTVLAAVAMPVIAADEEFIDMEPMYGETFQPDGVTFGRVSFLIPDVQGLTKDGWDNNIDHNEDLVLISYVKDGVLYEHQTVKEIKAAWGNKALMRTCYTYDDASNGRIRLNLVLHMDDHNTLKPADITLVTLKKGFVWCVGSPSGITGEMPALTLDRDVSFFTGEAGITAVKTGSMGSEGTSLNLRFDRKDSESLKAISAVDLCPSAVPGKTLGDLVTIGGETVTELVKKGNVARFNFFGDTMVFHVDDPEYLAKIKNEHLEFVINPGFRWMNWHQDDWGNWAGSHKNDYTPVEGTLVTKPIVFYLDENADVCIRSNGISVVPGYKDTYYVGDRLDMTTLLINVNYAGGDVVETPILEKMCEYDFSKPGKAEVKITVLGMTTSYQVTVLPLEASETETEPYESETEPESETLSEPVDTEADTVVETEAVTYEETEPETTPVAEPEATPETMAETNVTAETEVESEKATDTEAQTMVATEGTESSISETLPQSTGAATDEGGCGAAVLPGILLLPLGVTALLKKKEN